jgi:hypothetical protein
MSKVVVNTSLTLDGVMQAPAGPASLRAGRRARRLGAAVQRYVIATSRPAESTPERSTS